MISHSYKIIVEPQDGGGFTAYAPKLPGCVSEGDTYDETLINIKEALQLYIDVLKDRKKEIIHDNLRVTEVSVAL